MDKKQKQIAIIAGAGIALFLLYRWYAGRNASGGTTQQVPPSATDPQYAAISGQEQSDTASLQRQILALTQWDRGMLKELHRLELGEQKLRRNQVVKVKKGSAFYNWYVRVTGHPPPASINVANWLYNAWRSGIKAPKLAPLFPHPPAKHPDQPPKKPKGHLQFPSTKPKHPTGHLEGLGGNHNAGHPNPHHHAHHGHHKGLQNPGRPSGGHGHHPHDAHRGTHKSGTRK